jgi:hypothetical protein
MRFGSLILACLLLCLAVTLLNAMITREGVGAVEYVTSAAIVAAALVGVWRHGGRALARRV